MLRKKRITEIWWVLVVSATKCLLERNTDRKGYLGQEEHYQQTGFPRLSLQCGLCPFMSFPYPSSLRRFPSWPPGLFVFQDTELEEKEKKARRRSNRKSRRSFRLSFGRRSFSEKSEEERGLSLMIYEEVKVREKGDFFKWTLHGMLKLFVSLWTMFSWPQYLLQ